MATDAEWERFTRYGGDATCGNSIHAQACRDTPLEPQAILDMVVSNLGYYGDSYYDPLTIPVDMRVSEFYCSIGRNAVGDPL